MNSLSRKNRKTIVKQLSLVFGLMTLVVVAMSVVLIGQIGRVSRLVTEMREDESAIRESLSLAASVREQYIHQAHWIIERDDDHIDHYGDWLVQIQHSAARLKALVPAERHEEIAQLEEASDKLDRLFRDALVPAARSNDPQKLLELHRQAESLSARAARHADSIAELVGHDMARFHHSADQATRVSLASAATGVLAFGFLAMWLTAYVRRSFFKPLDTLTAAARRFGAGNFDSPVGAVGDGELAAVADAFTSMAAELKVREKKLIDSERMAAIGQLAAGVAHEINNPIQVIRGYLRTMSRENDGKPFAEEIRILDEEANACQRIAEDLTVYSRAPEVVLRETDIAMLVEESIRRFRETAEGIKHEIVSKVEPAALHADSARLRQVLLNLLLNAAQASDPGKIIEVSGRRLNDGQYEIAISDTGSGVAAADKERIFEPFFSRRPGGSGLGLAVCHGIVRAHGGLIRADDGAGGGTTMRVVVPLSPAVEGAYS